jgi:hypothetical protein
MRELRPGLWHWQAPHPDWSADGPWHLWLPSINAVVAGDSLSDFR